MQSPEPTVWWHVYPLVFCGAPIRDADPAPGPRLRRLLAWLDHAQDLGFTGLLLGPIFASQTHGYDTLDHFRVDPRLGDEQDLQDLIDACRDRGMRLVLDGVFSHVGSGHPDLRRALDDGPGGPTADVFDIDWERREPRVFEGHGALARLDHSSDAAADYVTRVMEHWLERGVDGWRLDAAYSVPVEFWARVLPRARAAHPDAWFLGEVIHGDYAGFVSASGVDTVTQYELWKAIWSSLADRNLFELEWSLARHGEFLQAFVPQTFVGNHDVTRIATTVGHAGAAVALAVLMTVGGTPSVYAGDEAGLTGVKENREGGDDDVRPAFPATPAQWSPESAALVAAHRDLVAVRRDRPWLAHATTETLELANERYRYRARAADGSAHLAVTLDLHGEPHAAIHAADGALLWQSRE